MAQESKGEFKDKVAVVTGGSRGIGRAIAAAFAVEGAQTVLAASSSDNLAAAATAIAKIGGPQPMTVAADLRALAGCEQVFNAVKDKFGRCDILVNSAGATKAGNFLALPDDLWTDGFALKFFGCVRLCRLFWPMLKEAHGNVINIDGGAARTPGADFTIGGSVNAAMANFSKSLSKLGLKDDVNVNVIHPGQTETERTMQLFQQRSAASGKSIEVLRDEEITHSGLRRMGQPEDIAALALFLCRPAARHIQGVAIAVDGGATPGVY
jgi:NAD(P)-dependent dehydrogenase (short-subunit alcohol dehydrogenase family)